MKNLTLIASLIAASAMPFAASAQTSNTINFTGTITKAACAVKSSSATGTSAKDTAGTSGITVNMGTVSEADIGTVGAQANGSFAAPAGVGANVTLTFNCSNTDKAGAGGSALNTFSVGFEPTEAQKDPNVVGALALGSDSSAKGVSIALFDNGKLVNVHDRQQLIAGKIASDGTGTMDLRAMYVKSGSTITPGSAKAALPFTVRYQ